MTKTTKKPAAAKASKVAKDADAKATKRAAAKKSEAEKRAIVDALAQDASTKPSIDRPESLGGIPLYIQDQDPRNASLDPTIEDAKLCVRFAYALSYYKLVCDKNGTRGEQARAVEQGFREHPASSITNEQVDMMLEALKGA